MTKICPSDFIGTRTRMHRLRDARVFNGWVRGFSGARVEVLTRAEAHVEVGDRFRFEFTGKKTSAVFEASLTKVDEYDVADGGVSYAIEGSSARVIEAEWVVFQFAIDGPFRYANADQPFRSRVKGLKAVVSLDGTSIHGEIIDVAQSGFSLRLDEAVIPGSRVQFEIETSIGAVSGVATVRNCNAWKGDGYRAGLEFEDMGRIDRPRWNRFLEEL